MTRLRTTGTTCEVCGIEVPPNARGYRPRFCTDACRMRGSRTRRGLNLGRWGGVRVKGENRVTRCDTREGDTPGGGLS